MATPYVDLAETEPFAVFVWTLTSAALVVANDPLANNSSASPTNMFCYVCGEKLPCGCVNHEDADGTIWDDDYPDMALWDGDNPVWSYVNKDLDGWVFPTMAA